MPGRFRCDAFLFWSRGPDGNRKNDRKRAVVCPWLVLELCTVLPLTQLRIRQSDWWRAGIRSTNLHVAVESLAVSCLSMLFVVCYVDNTDADNMHQVLYLPTTKILKVNSVRFSPYIQCNDLITKMGDYCWKWIWIDIVIDWIDSCK